MVQVCKEKETALESTCVESESALKFGDGGCLQVNIVAMVVLISTRNHDGVFGLI